MPDRDRFELLTAYLDGEVTAAERREVEDRLTTDPEVQHLYARVLQLRQKWQTIPTLAQQPVERTLGQGFPGLHNRSKMAVVWCGTVLVAVLLSSFLGVPPEHQSSVSSITQAPQQRLVLRKLSPGLD